jgi:hypothetical protein
MSESNSEKLAEVLLAILGVIGALIAFPFIIAALATLLNASTPELVIAFGTPPVLLGLIALSQSSPLDRKRKRKHPRR